MDAGKRLAQWKIRATISTVLRVENQWTGISNRPVPSGAPRKPYPSLTPPMMTFPYKVRRSQRKTAAIHIGRDGVEVRVPVHVKDAWIKQWLTQKQAWILSKLAEQETKVATQTQLKWGQPILFLGEEIPVLLSQGAKVSHRSPQVIFDGTSFQVALHDETQLRPLMEAWFKHQAKQYMTPRAHEIAQDMGVRARLKQVRFRRTKTKWGHCTQHGDLQFNWQIMGAPKGVIDYLICHEVSHLIHPNHSRAFWQTVASWDANYLSHEKWLKDDGFRLTWH